MIVLQPGDIFVSHEGYTVRLMTPEEYAWVKHRVAECVKRAWDHLTGAASRE